jgi:hypothetical protein
MRDEEQWPRTARKGPGQGSSRTFRPPSCLLLITVTHGTASRLRCGLAPMLTGDQPPQAGQAPLTSVRAGSVSQRSSTGSSGHQRSPKVTERRGPHESLAGSVDGRCSLPAADRMPQAVVAAQAASGSRPWCRPRGCRARDWRPARGRWLGRRPVARHTDRAVPRSAGPAPGRARSPPEQGIELVFEIESGILLTAVPAADGTLGHIGGTEPQHPRVSSGSSRRLIGLVAGPFATSRRRSRDRSYGPLIVRQRSTTGPARYDLLHTSQGRPCGRPPAAAVLGRQHHWTRYRANRRC